MIMRHIKVHFLISLTLALLIISAHAGMVCVHGFCSNENTKPSDCSAAPTSASNKFRRWMMENVKSTEFHVRGMPFCYYLAGSYRGSTACIVNKPTQVFLLPAGRYILHWAVGYDTGPASFANGISLHLYVFFYIRLL